MATATRNPRLDAALTYAALGWRVLPCWWVDGSGRCGCGKAPCTNKPGKHPLSERGGVPRGCKDASTDPGVVRDWWRRWPLANPAVATGPGSGIWVLGPDGELGRKQLADLAGLHPGEPIPAGPRARTGSGGLHLYFAWPDDGGPDFTIRANWRGTKIDFRGAGGYVVAPPGVNANGPYEWEAGTERLPPARAPAWLLEWVRTDGKPAPAPPAAKPRSAESWWDDRKWVLGRASQYLRRCAESVSGQRGHDAILWAASVLVHGFELADHEAEALLLAEFNPRCVPPWPERDVRRKVREARSHPLDKPRGWLLNSRDPFADSAPPWVPPAGGGYENNGRHRAAGPKAEEWQSPIPLDDPTDTPPAFPMGCLPARLAELCVNIGETIGCPPDYAGCFALAVAAGTCGAAVVLDVKADWEEHASLFVCAVAPPNAGKTPSFKLITRPVIEEQSRRFAEENRKPAYVSDVTVEKLADILKDEPRGALLLRDELAGWVKGMDQYKARGGSDRQFWLSVWSSDAVNVHRKNPDSPHVFIPHPCVSVAGGIQPEVLRSLRGNDDGFFDRVLFTYPVPLPAKGEDWRSCGASLADSWKNALSKVRGVDMREEPGRLPRPRFVRLSPPAKAGWERYTAELAGRINDPEFPAHLGGVAGKLKGYAARLALVSMLLRIAYERDGEPEDLTADDMAAGAALAGYFLGHAQRVYRAMGRDPRIEPARKVLRWITTNKHRSFTRADAWDALRKGNAFRRPEDLSDPLWLLTLHRYVRAAREGEVTGPGRRPTRTYEVSTHLFPASDQSEQSDQSTPLTARIDRIVRIDRKVEEEDSG